ncbi:MAG: hypothetical protein KAG92_01420 [Deltaproteobacteria bacterium]|nr:hypothetical protein [Deltaproteobacteria bacterium]
MDLSNNIVAKSILQATDNNFRYKDAKKFKSITKFIGHGSEHSSTEAYRIALQTIANTGQYSETDIVGISVEGRRHRRKTLDTEEVLKAIKGRATIVTDDYANRCRHYNLGERQVAEFLLDHRYREQDESGIWLPMSI